MPDKKLVVIGDGPDFKKIKRLSAKNVILMGYQPLEVLKHFLSKAKAFVFAAEEDFGIISVEAQACGTPVIAYGKGGSRETVVDGKTGVFFYEQSVESIVEAVIHFENNIHNFDYLEIAEHAKTFSTQRFNEEFMGFLTELTNNKKIIA